MPWIRQSEERGARNEEGGTRRIAKCDIRTAHNLVSQVVASFVGRVEPQLQVVVSREVIDQRPTVTAESRSVSHNSLCVEADDGVF